MGMRGAVLGFEFPFGSGVSHPGNHKVALIFKKSIGKPPRSKAQLTGSGVCSFGCESCLEPTVRGRASAPGALRLSNVGNAEEPGKDLVASPREERRKAGLRGSWRGRLCSKRSRGAAMAGAGGRLWNNCRPSGTMGTQKPRILPWLVSQLDQGHLEGVAWVNESRTRFRIPWKHGLRHDAQQEDFGIFQAWAEASGAYTPGKDKPDLPTWKRNFRSALNRKEALHLVDDRSKDPHDPHKIYEFVTSGGADFSQLDTSPDPSGKGITPDTQEDTLEDLLGDMVLAHADGGPSGLAVGPEQCPQLLLSPNLNSPAPCPNLEPLENPLRRLLVPEDDWEFEVTAFYRGRQVFQQTVFCPGGLRLVGSEEEDRTLPGQPITLPDPELSLADRGVTDYVKRVLSCLGGGLALWRAGQGLWAQRLGHCGTYWALGEELLPDSGHGPVGEVPKDKEGVVFDLGPFVAEDGTALSLGGPRTTSSDLWTR
ncbi:interferon regulatory factor 3 isoform X2 [Tupaia chinensis]|uniref:interferon regulatory factor 3 isoform X2 n=1 Tax=Tupaia chinensis TaxID=246437 RepID=UPI000FFBB3BE|nr:interferon regulatory factor 3 isoform X2 [Tupaia chinensis]